MYVVAEQAAYADLAALDRAWGSPETFAFVPDKVPTGVGWVEDALRTLPEELQRDHFALLTSGSTGLPKLIVGARARAERLAKLLHEVQDNGAASEAVLALPLSYSYAFVNQWLWARVTGRRLVVTRGFAEPDVLQTALRRADRALLCLVGAQVGLLDAVGSGPFGVVRLHFAGGPFPQGKLDVLRARFPQARIFNNYGCAEAMPRLTVRPAEDALDGAIIGRPLPGVELRIADGGELQFRSAYGAVGFIDAAGFRAVGREDWVATGDVGTVLEDGRFKLAGRASEVFKRYGEKISLPLLHATVTARWPGQVAFYREKDRSGEEGHVLVLAPHPSEMEVREVLQGFRRSHPRPHWPLRLESVDALPLLRNGKVDVGAVAASGAKQVHWDQRI